MKTTLRIPAQSVQVVAGHFGYGVDILAQVRMDTLADALNAMEHDDLGPGVRPMNADQCRDALLRELLGGWTPSELVEAKIPGVLQMADEIATLRRERDEARARIAGWTWNIPNDGPAPIIEGDHTPPSIADCAKGWFVKPTTPATGAQP